MVSADRALYSLIVFMPHKDNSTHHWTQKIQVPLNYFFKLAGIVKFPC